MKSRFCAGLFSPSAALIEQRVCKLSVSMTEVTASFCAALSKIADLHCREEIMPKKTRRFGAYHRASKFSQPPLNRMFPPSEIDPLLLELLGDEKSGVRGEESGVSEKSVVGSDKSGERAGKKLSWLEKFSTEDCGKACGKTAFGRYKFLTSLDF